MRSGRSDKRRPRHHVTEKREEMDRYLADAQERANEAVSGIQQQLTDAQSHLSAIENLKSLSQDSIEEIQVSTAQAHEKYDEFDARSKAAAQQQSDLEKLIATATELEERVEGLLPGATSAGLAAAFKERRETFRIPKLVWAWTVVLALGGLFLAVYFDPLRSQFAEPTFGALVGYLFSRLPFAIPVIWLAWYAARRHSQTLRLEEDYAHKEVLSKSFEGYKKQILELEAADVRKEQTLNLIQKTLDALVADPGRIYRERNEDGTPFSAFFRRRNESPNDNES